jgi:hypothetical protein
MAFSQLPEGSDLDMRHRLPDHWSVWRHRFAVDADRRE